MKLRIFLLLITCLCSLPGFAEDLGRVRAEKMGMSSERLARLSGLDQKYVAEGKLAGVITMVARHGKIVHEYAAGTLAVPK